MTQYDALYALIAELVACHSPSGVEGEIDAYLIEAFRARGVEAKLDSAGNIIAKIAGSGRGTLAITAHKDEIGASVRTIESDGRLRVRRLGGSYPWIYGEGAVDVIGDRGIIPGVLSFGSRHVSHASSQHAHMDKAPVRWEDAWVETKLSADELTGPGVRPGSRVVVSRGRKKALRLKDHIASYTLDNKASLAVLLGLAERVRDPLPNLYLVASTKEEVGASGALYFTQRSEIDALIALEIAPLSSEYDIKDSQDPVIFAEDSFSLYDETLNRALIEAARAIHIELQTCVVTAFGSDASVTLRSGHVPRAACLAFATQNTHGFEIARLDAITHCGMVLERLCRDWAL